MEPLHSLLKRQLKKYWGTPESLPEERRSFIEAVNSAYRQFDDDRAMLERSLDLSSQELLQANSEMRAVFERLVNSSVDGIAAVDRERRLTVWNPAMERITGLKKTRVLGKGVFDLFPSLKGEEPFLRDALAGKTGIVKDRAYIRPEGGRGFLEAHYAPILNESAGIVGGFALIRDVTERREAEEQVKRLVNYDPLTGLPNRTLFVDRLNQALARAPWNKRLAAVLFLNLNRFKLINEMMGHPVGDRLLKGVSRRLTAALRDGDTVARLGGDEYALILEDVAEARDLTGIVQKIVAVFAKPFALEGREIFATPSIGISLYPSDGGDVETLLKNAEAAMSRARDQEAHYQFFSPDMNAKTAKRLTLESSLRRALEREEFLLCYQPQVDLSAGRIIGMEALIRWRHPELGMVSPAEFIPLAEETGMIIPIGAWALETACRQGRAWQEAGFSHVHVAVNLSARQFQDHDLVETVRRVLAETGMAPGSLELELTESILMKDVENAIEMLGRLQGMGIEISMDDFGTGYSSLGYLRRFPINSLKIDRSFVKEIPANRDDAAIVQGIISLAGSLNLRVVAEGVETEEQLEFLRSLNCHAMQGYLFSKPAPAEAATRLLFEEKHL